MRRRAGGVVVQELLEVVERRHQVVHVRGHVDRVTRTRAADPVLTAPELARRFVRAASASYEDAVNLADETQAQRKPLAQSRQHQRGAIQAADASIGDLQQVLTFRVPINRRHRRQIRGHEDRSQPRPETGSRIVPPSLD